MALIPKNDVNQIFGSQAPDQDKPAQFNNYTGGWDVSRINNGKPTIKQFNYLQQRTDQNILYIHQNGGALPYDTTIEYAENATVLIDGELKQKKGNQWVSVGAKNDSDITTWSGRNQREKNKDVVNILDFGANSNNALLSSIFTSLAEAKLKYPFVENLTMTVNDLALILYKQYLDSNKKNIINFPQGQYKFNISHDNTGYTINCDTNTKIDFSDSIDDVGFYSNNDFTDEVGVNNVSSNVIYTVDASNYEVGDWCLLKSTTRCDSPEAGDDWQLGAATANATPTYFAEPVQIIAKSGNTLTAARGVIFPQYSKNVDGKVATLSKINFSNSNILGFPEIIMPKKYFLAIQSKMDKDSKYEINFSTSITSGIGFTSQNSMSCDVKGVATRPVYWELNDEDHSRYNTWKSISGWFNKFDITEYNGSQTIDQTYKDICSLMEQFKVRAINPKEQGITTHGMAYGTYIDAFVYNNVTSALSNRARFTTIDLVAVGNGLITNANNIGLSLLDFGMTDVVANVHISNQKSGVKFDKSYTNVAYTPLRVNAQISGKIDSCFNVYEFSRKVPDSLSIESSIILSANSTDCNRILEHNNTSGWNNVSLSGSHTVVNDSTIDRLVKLANATAGWVVSNFTASGYSESTAVFNLPSTANVLEGWSQAITIDWDSCKFLGLGDAISTGNNYFRIITNVNTLLTTNNNLLLNSPLIIVNTASIANYTLNIPLDSGKIPIGKLVTILCQNSTVKIVGENGVTVLGNIPDGVKTVTFVKTSANTYYVNGY